MDIAICPTCDREYLVGFRGEHDADYHGPQTVADNIQALLNAGYTVCLKRHSMLNPFRDANPTLTDAPRFIPGVFCTASRREEPHLLYGGVFQTVAEAVDNVFKKLP